ncbi:MAG: hypothetical protein DWQ30_13220 [Acidobacteria bacterium]|nr:MAG: hypothetical protein DWQ30_13220 [Acidobacteriota bacterium]
MGGPERLSRRWAARPEVRSRPPLRRAVRSRGRRRRVCRFSLRSVARWSGSRRLRSAGEEALPVARAGELPALRAVGAAAGHLFPARVVRGFRRAAKLLVAVTTLGLCLGAAELALRGRFPDRTGVGTEHRVPHPRLGWVLEPGARFSHRIDGRDVDVAYNSAGFRDVERRPESKQRPRVLVLGDSFVEAYSVRFEESFPRLLEESLGDEGVDAEVVNLGVGGYGTLQEYLLYREVGRAYRPDVVLLGFYTQNDVRNNSRELEQRLRRNSLKGSSRPFLVAGPDAGWTASPVDYELAWEHYSAATERRRSLRSRLHRGSALYRALRAAIGGRGDRRDDLEVVPREGADDLLQERFEALYGVGACDESPAFRDAWARTAEILGRLGKEVEAEGARLVVFSVPAAEEVDPDLVARWPAAYQQLAEGLCLREGVAERRLEARLEALGIPFIGLLPEFRRELETEETRLHSEQDRHWTPAAHALAAEVVAARIARSGILASSSPQEGSS